MLEDIKLQDFENGSADIGSGEELRFGQIRHIIYVANPIMPSSQSLSVFIPEQYLSGSEVNGWNIHTAPIFMPNRVLGYMPGYEDAPGIDPMTHGTNSIAAALQRGFVVVSPAERGRGMKDDAGHNIGVAPADIVDLKAAVRFIRSHVAPVAGDPDHIITNGTSAGGAMSALLGCTGNHPDYLPYLEEIGAEDQRDDVFACSCYCPIVDLEHADMAYEWEFRELDNWSRMDGIPPEDGSLDISKFTFVKKSGTLSYEEREISDALAERFIPYLNSLSLVNERRKPLTLQKDGSGSFRDFIESHVLASAQTELDRGVDIESQDGVSSWLYVRNGRAASMDWEGFVRFRTRMKRPPAFDGLDMDTPETQLFGSRDVEFRHFSDFCRSYSGGAMAEPEQVKMMNPLNYIGDDRATMARHFRIRHGSMDSDTSIAVSNILYAKLAAAGADADIAHPWGIPHAGDYDLPEMFDWVEKVCRR